MCGGGVVMGVWAGAGGYVVAHFNFLVLSWFVCFNSRKSCLGQDKC